MCVCVCVCVPMWNSLVLAMKIKNYDGWVFLALIKMAKEMSSSNRSLAIVIATISVVEFSRISTKVGPHFFPSSLFLERIEWKNFYQTNDERHETWAAKNQPFLKCKKSNNVLLLISRGDFLIKKTWKVVDSDDGWIRFHTFSKERIGHIQSQ